MKHDEYTYLVSWSEPDREFVGTTLEFGSYLSHLDRNPEQALAGIRDLVRFVLDDMAKNGETPPKPASVESVNDWVAAHGRAVTS